MRKREILGLLFLIIGASGIFLSVRQSPPQYIYLTASRDISPGEIVRQSDFRQESLYLSNAASHYVSANARVVGHRAIRKISVGELVPREALTRAREIEERHLLTFNVSQSESPPTLQVGDLIDIYFFELPEGGAPDEKIKLIRISSRIRIQYIASTDNQIDGRLTISAFFAKEESGEIMSLIADSKISISQRFDDEG